MKLQSLVGVMYMCISCAGADTAEVVAVTNDDQSRHHATVRAGHIAYDIYCEDYSTEDAQRKIEYRYCTLSAGERLSYRLEREGDLHLIVFTPDKGRWVIQREEQR